MPPIFIQQKWHDERGEGKQEHIINTETLSLGAHNKYRLGIFVISFWRIRDLVIYPSSEVEFHISQ